MVFNESLSPRYNAWYVLEDHKDPWDGRQDAEGSQAFLQELDHVILAKSLHDNLASFGDSTYRLPVFKHIE